MIDGIDIIERLHQRGALIKVLDKPHLDLTTPIGRGFIAFRGRATTDHQARQRRQAGRQGPRNPIWTQAEAQRAPTQGSREPTFGR
jgi:hypothetical protein